MNRSDLYIFCNRIGFQTNENGEKDKGTTPGMNRGMIYNV